jgi:hypothetical protein
VDLVRVLCGVALAVAVVVAALARPPAPLPQAALGTEVVWRLEVALVVALVLVVGVVVLVRSVIGGELPARLSGEGLEYERRVAADAAEAAGGLRDRVEELAGELRATREELSRTSADLIALGEWAAGAHLDLQELWARRERAAADPGGTLGP